MRTNRQQAVIIYNGLDVNCEITSVDPLDQVFYAGSNTYIPNRSLTPLVLIPKLEIMNIDGVKVATEFTKTSWYLGEIKPDNLITSKITTDAFYLDGLNLVVKKNLTTPIQISFLGEFLDKRTNKVIQVPRVVELSISSSSEVAPAPTIGIDRPADWAFNPIKDNNLQTLTASVFVNEKSYASAVHWLVEHNGKKESIELFDCYISGQNSQQLVVDTNKLPSGALIHAENLSEADYNKVYGINPDWDSKMKEVFENRNYLRNSELDRNFVDGWIRYEIVGVENLLNKDLIFNYDSEIGFDVDAILTDWDWVEAISVKKNTPFKMSSGKKYLAFTTKAKDKSLSHVKMELGKSTTPYTPAPEDLNYQNLIVNGDFRDGDKGWLLHGCKAKFTTREVVLTPEVKIGHNGIWCVVNIGLNYNDLVYMACLIKPQTNKSARFSAFNSELAVEDFRKAKINEWNYSSAIVRTGSSSRNNVSFYHQSEGYLDNQSFELKNPFSINLTRTFGAGNEPSLEVCDSIFKDMPYIPAPQDYAPDGIIPGEYTTSIPFFVKYPTLDVDVEPFGDIVEGQTDLKVNAIVEYNKGRIANPSQFLDMKFIIIDDNDKEEVAGTGNSVTIATARLTGNKSIVLDWDFKKRPTTLTKI